MPTRLTEQELQAELKRLRSLPKEDRVAYQRQLISDGLYAGDLDGKIGKNTEDAVRTRMTRERDPTLKNEEFDRQQKSEDLKAQRARDNDAAKSAQQSLDEALKQFPVELRAQVSASLSSLSPKDRPAAVKQALTEYNAQQEQTAQQRRDRVSRDIDGMTEGLKPEVRARIRKNESLDAALPMVQSERENQRFQDYQDSALGTGLEIGKPLSWAVGLPTGSVASGYAANKMMGNFPNLQMENASRLAPALRSRFAMGAGLGALGALGYFKGRAIANQGTDDKDAYYVKPAKEAVGNFVSGVGMGTFGGAIYNSLRSLPMEYQTPDSPSQNSSKQPAEEPQVKRNSFPTETPSLPAEQVPQPEPQQRAYTGIERDNIRKYGNPEGPGGGGSLSAARMAEFEQENLRLQAERDAALRRSQNALAEVPSPQREAPRGYAPQQQPSSNALDPGYQPSQTYATQPQELPRLQEARGPAAVAAPAARIEDLKAQLDAARAAPKDDPAAQSRIAELESQLARFESASKASAAQMEDKRVSGLISGRRDAYANSGESTLETLKRLQARAEERGVDLSGYDFSGARDPKVAMGDASVIENRKIADAHRASPGGTAGTLDATGQPVGRLTGRALLGHAGLAGGLGLMAYDAATSPVSAEERGYDPGDPRNQMIRNPTTGEQIRNSLITVAQGTADAAPYFVPVLGEGLMARDADRFAESQGVPNSQKRGEPAHIAMMRDYLTAKAAQNIANAKEEDAHQRAELAQGGRPQPSFMGRDISYGQPAYEGALPQNAMASQPQMPDVRNYLAASGPDAAYYQALQAFRDHFQPQQQQ